MVRSDQAVFTLVAHNRSDLRVSEQLEHPGVLPRGCPFRMLVKEVAAAGDLKPVKADDEVEVPDAFFL